MNERIKELANKAGCDYLYDYSVDGHAIVCNLSDIEKLAELIVKECLSIVKSNTYGPCGEYDYSYSDENSAADDRAETIYEEIAYRFGVEE
jgi:hypothetical protein